mgnify:FL=1
MKIELKRASIQDAEFIWHMQVEAFADLLEKYKDYDTSPGCEPLEKVQMRLNQPFTYFYLICGENASTQRERGEAACFDILGAIRVIDKKEAGKKKKISPIFVKKEYRGMGIAQKAIALAEEMHGSDNWELDTILQEAGNCYLYEKMGYKTTGETKVINERLTLVFYEK